MFEVDACYKIMFESMFEQCELKDIVEKICLHIHASVCYVLNSGRIPAYACTPDMEHVGILKTMTRGYITLSEYDQYKEEKINEDHCIQLRSEELFLVKSDIVIQGKTIGACVIFFRDADMKESFQLVCDILRQVSSDYFSEEDILIFGNVPMRKLIYLQTAFRDDKDSMERVEREIQTEFLEVLFPNIESVEQKEKLFHKIQNIWNVCGMCVEEHSMTAVFCDVSRNNMDTITERLDKLGIYCCVSEQFAKLNMCRRKKRLLEQMSLLKKTISAKHVIEEKDKYVSLIYTYALPILQETGLRDDSIDLLMKEDTINNTELFHTLKTYLLCENRVSETAKALHIHRNTLVYRLKQIREILNKDIDDNRISRELLAYMMLFDIARQIEVE